MFRVARWFRLWRRRLRLALLRLRRGLRPRAGWLDLEAGAPLSVFVQPIPLEGRLALPPLRSRSLLFEHNIRQRLVRVDAHLEIRSVVRLRAWPFTRRLLAKAAREQAFLQDRAWEAAQLLALKVFRHAARSQKETGSGGKADAIQAAPDSVRQSLRLPIRKEGAGFGEHSPLIERSTLLRRLLWIPLEVRDLPGFYQKLPAPFSCSASPRLAFYCYLEAGHPDEPTKKNFEESLIVGVCALTSITAIHGALPGLLNLWQQRIFLLRPAFASGGFSAVYKYGKPGVSLSLRHKKQPLLRTCIQPNRTLREGDLLEMPLSGIWRTFCFDERPVGVVERSAKVSPLLNRVYAGTPIDVPGPTLENFVAQHTGIEVYPPSGAHFTTVLEVREKPRLIPFTDIQYRALEPATHESKVRNPPTSPSAVRTAKSVHTFRASAIRA